MAKLKAATRNALPASEKAKVQMVKRGKLSPEAASRIRAKANRLISGGK